MTKFTTVTDQDLERARQDPAFRRMLLSKNLEALLVALNKMRSTGTTLDQEAARQIRDGVDLAVKLADMLQTARRDDDPPQAA